MRYSQSVTAKFFTVPEIINLIFLPWYKVLLRPLVLHFSCRWLPISQWAKDRVTLTGIGTVLLYLLLVVPIERHSPFQKLGHLLLSRVVSIFQKLQLQVRSIP